MMVKMAYLLTFACLFFLIYLLLFASLWRFDGCIATSLVFGGGSSGCALLFSCDLCILRTLPSTCNSIKLT